MQIKYFKTKNVEKYILIQLKTDKLLGRSQPQKPNPHLAQPNFNQKSNYRALTAAITGKLCWITLRIFSKSKKLTWETAITTHFMAL